MRQLLLFSMLLICFNPSFSQDNSQSPKELDLAYQYLMALDVPKDDAKARTYFKEAAEKYDNDEAYSMLSFMYLTGMGGERNITQSVEILSRLAEKNDPHSQSVLAQHYLEGTGVDKDFDKAFYWAQKAYENNPADIIFNSSLGFYYYLGLGTPQDFKKAYEHYKVSAELGDVDSQFQLSELYSLGLGTDQDLTKALYWAEKAYEQGDSVARKKLSVIYQIGQGTSSDLKKSFKFLLAAATTGDASAQYDVALAYNLGIGTEIDPNAHLAWLYKSCSKGYKLACEDLDVLNKELENNL